MSTIDPVLRAAPGLAVSSPVRRAFRPAGPTPAGSGAPWARRSLAGRATHALSPDAVLVAYRQITGEDPPPAFVLCVRGESFGLGDDVSATARAPMRLLRVVSLRTQVDGSRSRAKRFATL